MLFNLFHPVLLKATWAVFHCSASSFAVLLLPWRNWGISATTKHRQGLISGCSFGWQSYSSLNNNNVDIKRVNVCFKFERCRAKLLYSKWLWCLSIASLFHCVLHVVVKIRTKSANGICQLCCIRSRSRILSTLNCVVEIYEDILFRCEYLNGTSLFDSVE